MCLGGSWEKKTWFLLKEEEQGGMREDTLVSDCNAVLLAVDQFLI